MIPKSQRLHKKAFAEVFKNGKRGISGFFSLYYSPIQKSGGRHFAVVVPKKISSKAVSRNKIRRRIYHILHQKYGNTSGSSMAIVLILRKNVVSTPFSSVKSEVESLLSKNNL
ncbi:MAG: ribonuclease P protein component [Candidatus Taylorbacteria bacterium RIFCSPLOWO2_02_FULL_43_11]|uniref:Ribonuclease P protein component n=1 Tax=Candidatus Taylorbacteria bacterium RIFCSPHIGHO2_02_FULL_43_32b TaxID=1802306 RepID=A0A1G2MJP4_9BACT|nr:MAG: ribonuclease P protein component [Candidatus Taylorbacteria bacterium RIFCSPHIGHO2_01_FULL_43_47]OHA24068.1 MAG: ribonuclease P protein component [Candidatus Taylorbacteria bacterium RIFCSPHIGHO2_02_FULL_43_32b]OHA31468.1 MAG: ribonuclease P protein component [Candidatus Taylorbacteria bacterium RIFCSPLOWO2_01_FULL_43_44]OHA37519.1 MAG: ribonuclease P protein component [Candidatus Taylorbacteria bacterium RIFCSPLOWO2_02_FULL_43_11]